MIHSPTTQQEFFEFLKVLGSDRRYRARRTDWPSGYEIFAPAGNGHCWLIIDGIGTHYTFTIEDRTQAAWELIVAEEEPT